MLLRWKGTWVFEGERFESLILSFLSSLKNILYGKGWRIFRYGGFFGKESSRAEHRSAIVYIMDLFEFCCNVFIDSCIKKACLIALFFLLTIANGLGQERSDSVSVNFYVDNEIQNVDSSFFLEFHASG
ncbi:hypothetical protein DDZ16_02000 [Marinilabilia rubra]|uniref:Uncharacterized protein n=1 Tax=Marinilabilia rubra TaxID=2162893 RepID=A0A2U2BDY4_9BACT|nr:hypothetical protein DDZ16_02000 [Marinilabilia rubra]